MTPIVSIIIPIYNTAATLARCIDSALAQSFADVEIVLVDDGSPDGAGDIADAYACRDARIHVVHQSNAGLAEARRAGIHAARGRYIVPLDSDDTMPERAVETLYRHMTEQDLDMVYGCYCRIDDKGAQHLASHRSPGVMSGSEFLRDELLTPGSICGAWANMSRRELWTDDIFPPCNLRLPSEDVFMLVKLTQHIARVALFNDVVYNYYYNPLSLSIAGPLHRQELWKQYFALIRDDLRHRGLLDELESHLRVMEVDRLAFYTHDIDCSDPWYQQVIKYADGNFPLKHRLLHRLLRHPRLLRTAIALRRHLR